VWTNFREMFSCQKPVRRKFICERCYCGRIKGFSIEGRRQGPFTAGKRAHAKIAFVKLISRGVHTKNEFWRRKK
jgi:hypothetical protein